jgi:hypothetical protein
MICKYCGKEMVDNSRFCPGCGRAVDIQEQNSKRQNKILPIAIVASLVVIGAGAGMTTTWIRSKHMAVEKVETAAMEENAEQEGTAAETEIVKTGWQQDEQGWRYIGADGNSQPEGWFTDDDGSQYYFDENGYILMDAVTPDGYYVNESGAYVSWDEVNAERNREAMTAYKDIVQGYIDNPSSYPCNDASFPESAAQKFAVLDINNDGIYEVLVYGGNAAKCNAELLYYTTDGIKTAEIHQGLRSYNPSTGQIYSSAADNGWTGYITTFDGENVEAAEEIWLSQDTSELLAHVDEQLEAIKKVEQYESGGAYSITGIELTAENLGQYLEGDGISTIHTDTPADSYINTYNQLMNDYRQALFDEKKSELVNSLTAEEIEDGYEYEFKYVDMNNDGVDELVSSWMWRGHTYGMSIWLYQDRSLKKVDLPGGMTYADITSSHKVIVSNAGHAGHCEYEVYQMIDDSFKQVDYVGWSGYDTEESPIRYYRYDNNDNVVCELTEEEFNKILE